MALNLDERDLKKFVLVGDRVLIKPKDPISKTKSGLYLPPSVQQNEKLLSGYIMKTGPGYPMPAENVDDEIWKAGKDDVRYLPLQAKEGDMAVFLQKSGWEIQFNNQKYIILPHTAILMLIRDEGLFE